MRTLIILLALVAFSAKAQQIGNFTSVAPVFQDELLHIPASHAFQVIAQEGDALGDGTVMGQWSDLTAYVPINGSSTHGYLCVNAEFVPGGVSIFEIQLNPNTKLWEVLNSKNADFSRFNCNVTIPGVLESPAGTIANCSGGVTPWGTVVTSEESDEVPQFICSYNGYKTFGWNVEINPVTGKPADYDNDGNPDKVWAMGCMKHENVAFANDSLTVYQGEDNSSAGYVFKFIMDTKANLGSGKLYALKLASNWTTTGQGQWILIPNTSKAERNGVTAAANSAGATKFDRVEDVEIGPDGKIYFTSTGQNLVFRFNDNDSTVSNFEIFVDNTTFPIVTSTGTVQALFSSPDNLAFDNQGNLWINQDGGENYFWVVGPTHTTATPDIRIFANTPDGCETTGTHFSPDGNYMFVSVQHPEENNSQWQSDVADRSVVFDKSTTMVIALKEFLGDTTTTGILGPNEDVGTLKNLVIYPNPVSDVFKLQVYSSIYDHVQLRIFDITGKEVKSAKYFLNLGRNELQVDGSQLPKGNYVLTIKHAKGNLTGTFQK